MKTAVLIFWYSPIFTNISQSDLSAVNSVQNVKLPYEIECFMNVNEIKTVCKKAEVVYYIIRSN